MNILQNNVRSVLDALNESVDITTSAIRGMSYYIEKMLIDEVTSNDKQCLLYLSTKRVSHYKGLVGLTITDFIKAASLLIKTKLTAGYTVNLIIEQNSHTNKIIENLNTQQYCEKFHRFLQVSVIPNHHGSLLDHYLKSDAFTNQLEQYFCYFSTGTKNIIYWQKPVLTYPIISVRHFLKKDAQIFTRHNEINGNYVISIHKKHITNIRVFLKWLFEEQKQNTLKVNTIVIKHGINTKLGENSFELCVLVNPSYIEIEFSALELTYIIKRSIASVMLSR